MYTVYSTHLHKHKHLYSVYTQIHKLVQTNTLAPEEMHLPTTNAHQHTFSQKHKKEHTVTQSAMILDRSNYSVNFNVRLTKIFFFGYLFLPFFVFLLLCYSGHTHLVFSSGEVNWGLELLEKGCLKLLNVL